MRFADLEAVTVDGFGTLLELESPIEPLRQALARHDVTRTATDVERAFAAEARHYRAAAHMARDAGTLARFRVECVRVFLDALAAPLDAAGFVDAFLAALVFRPAAGAQDALGTLRRRGLKTAVASNWDCSLAERVDALGLTAYFDTVVTSAEAGVPKPDPHVLQLALERLDAHRERALHIGDEGADAIAAERAGMRFAPAPLARAVAALS